MLSQGQKLTGSNIFMIFQFAKQANILLNFSFVNDRNQIDKITKGILEEMYD